MAAIPRVPWTFKEALRFPAIDIDLSFVTDTFGSIVDAIHQTNAALIYDYKMVSVYGQGKDKSLTVRITFAHPERTLMREKVIPIVNEIIRVLQSRGVVIKA